MGLCRLIKVGQCCARLNIGALALGIHADIPHCGKVNHYAVIAQRVARDVMSRSSALGFKEDVSVRDGVWRGVVVLILLTLRLFRYPLVSMLWTKKRLVWFGD